MRKFSKERTTSTDDPRLSKTQKTLKKLELPSLDGITGGIGETKSLSDILGFFFIEGY